MRQRLQRRRTKGYKLPSNAIYVGRPSRWGNPYSLSHYGRERAIELYRCHAEREIAANPDWLAPLRGKDLACWCALDQACHADVLLELLKKESQ